MVILWQSNFVPLAALIFLLQFLRSVAEDTDFCASVFETQLDHALLGHVLNTGKVVDKFECHLKCLANDTCQSFNCQSNGTYGNRTCELNNQTRQQRPEDFQERKGFDYYGSVPVSCISSSRDDQEFELREQGQCHPGYKGKRCEKRKVGSVSSSPGHSCKQILDLGDSTGNGEYWIDPENTGKPLKFYCDMTAGSAVVSGPAYENIGCYQDQSARAIATIEGQDPILDGNYGARANATDKCYKAAHKRGFKVFALQNGGECRTSATAVNTFNKYGSSSSCNADGKGGSWTNQVYYIKGNSKMGFVSSSPGHSCKQILDLGDSRGDGEYWIDPENNGKPLKVYCDMTTDGGGWLLVTNFVIDSSTPPSNLEPEPSYRAVSYYTINRMGLSKDAMTELRRHVSFTQLRFHCSKQQGRTFHVITAANGTGEAVVQYFSGQTDVMPDSCHSFVRMADDSSQLASHCDKWGRDVNGTVFVGTWGVREAYGQRQLFNSPAYIDNQNRWLLRSPNFCCDDFSTGELLSEDFWKIYVR